MFDHEETMNEMYEDLALEEAAAFEAKQARRKELAEKLMKDLSDHLNHPQSEVSDADVLAFESGAKFILSRLEFRI